MPSLPSTEWSISVEMKATNPHNHHHCYPPPSAIFMHLSLTRSNNRHWLGVCTLLDVLYWSGPCRATQLCVYIYVCVRVLSAIGDIAIPVANIIRNISKHFKASERSLIAVEKLVVWRQLVVSGRRHTLALHRPAHLKQNDHH